MTYDKKVTSKSVKLMMITLDCFFEFVVILNKKLDQSRTRDTSINKNLIIQDVGGETIEIKEVLRMFEGIVDFILNGLFGHSDSVTKKIYTLLKEILSIEKEMEQLVAISLFESIKKHLNDKIMVKTHDILDNMFDLIHPLTFVKWVIVYSNKKVRDKKKQEYIVTNMINITTNTLIKKLGGHFKDVSAEMFAEHINRSNKWINLWAKEPISFLKMCIFNFKFDLSLKILELEVSQYSQPKDLQNFAIKKDSSLQARLKKIDSMLDITDDKREKLEKKVRKYDREKKLGKLRAIFKEQTPEIDQMGKFLVKLEEVYKMVISQAFVKRLSIILDESIKAKLMKFVGSIILLSKNTKDSTSQLKKLHLLPISPFTSTKKAQSMLQLGYEEDKLYTLYYQARVNGNIPSSPEHCHTPAVGKRSLGGRVRIGSGEKGNFSSKLDLNGFDLSSLVKNSNK